MFQFSSVQLLSHVRLVATPWITARQASLSITNSQSSLTLTSIKSVTPSSYLILCHPLLLLPPTRWPKYWSFSFSIIPSKEIPGLISFRMDWLDLLAVQGTLKSLLQHHNSKASILRCSAHFKAQLSHSYVTTGKSIALTIWIFVRKVMSLLLNTVSRFVIVFLPKNKHILSSLLQLLSSVLLEFKKIKSVTASTFSPSLCHEVMGPDAMILGFLMLIFKPAFSLSSFTLIKRFFSSSSLAAIKVSWSAYVRLLMFPQILIKAWDSSSLAFHMMYSA